MTKEDITRMAREAKQYAEYVTPQGMEWFDIYNERFAALIASAAQAKEREACAKWLEDVVDAPNWAEAIRARGQA